MNKLLQKEFGFRQVEIKQLNGYDNLNYLVKTEAGKFIFKTYPESSDSLALVTAENEILLALQKPGNDKYPRPIQFSDGSFVKCIEIAGKETICRILSFLEGQPIADVKHSKSLFESLGTFLAQLDIELQLCNNYTIKARRWEWSIEYLNLNKKYIADIAGPKNHSLVSYFFQQFAENVAPVLPDLRKTYIHNDANEWNVLVNNGKVSGIIDFGDLAYTALINELAVAMAYACFDKEDPLEWASTILKSYHQVLPVQENEIAVLYYLVAARICISVCNSSHSRRINSKNEYAFVSEKQAWALLHRWMRINPIAAENCFRADIGLTVEKPQSVDKLIKARHKVISPVLGLSYARPINMVKAAFQYMYDAYGNTYLDAYNNIPHVGHSHPTVVAASQAQIARLNTNTRYLYDLLPEYAERLLAKFPAPLDKVYFVNSGSAATDLAIRLARAHTGSKNLMVVEHGYHGNTQIGIDISDYKFSAKSGPGQQEHILKTAIPDTYRGKYKDEGSAGKMYAVEAIKQIERSDSPVAAFISEPILGCAGQVPLAPGYLKEVYQAIRNQGGVCISDEVQTGFGRLGEHFWGFEAQAVVPDIVILGKPMGNGHPIGAVVTTTEIADSFSKGVEFFSSFGGNPVSCAIGLAVLDVIESENLQENARLVGEFYKALFSNLQKEFSCIGDVRGSGLFIGVELVKDNNSLEPDGKLANLIKNELRNRHILIDTDGPDDSVLKTKPPLCFTRENAQQVTDQIYEILKT